MTSSRKLAVALGAVGLVVALAVAGVLWWRSSNAEDTAARPTVTVVSAGETTVVQPLRYCDLTKLREAFLSISEWEATGEKTLEEDPEGLFAETCETTEEPAMITVEEGSPVELTLPTAIADAPWSMLTMYQGAAGDEDGGIEVFRPGQQSEVTVPAADEAGRRLTVIEVRLPAGIIDPETGEEDFISHATWAINAR